MTSFDSPSNNIDEWISAIQGKSPIISTPTYHEGLIIRDLILKYSQERQEIQWDKVLENAHHDGLLENNLILESSQLPHAIPSKIRYLTASNKSWILLIASVAILTTSIYVLLPKMNDEPRNNGLANTMGGGTAKQFIYVGNEQTPKSIAEKIELLFKTNQVGYTRVNASEGRVQFIARIPANSPARGELEKLGIPSSALSESEEFSDFVLVPTK